MAGTTRNDVAVWTVPDGDVTAIGPVTTPDGAVAVILLSELTVNEAVDPLNVTALAALSAFPLSVTFVLVLPDVGEKLEIVGVGSAVTVNDAVAVPPGVVTVS